ncbi:MAG: hypothetical protein QOH21_2071 [Acidobacteriota bacterium]|jgi:hypothetical protein|nr:hypothetical protein [Acidobacteriota bacterium]
MKIKLFLVMLVTLALSAPAFAFCGHCDDWLGECVADEGPGGCRTVFTSPDTWECRIANASCHPAGAAQVSALTLVSVETTRQALTIDAKPVAAAPAVAVANVSSAAPARTR